MKNVSNIREKTKAHTLFSITFFEYRAVYKISGKILWSGADQK
jgi:hypothetical protein